MIDTKARYVSAKGERLGLDDRTLGVLVAIFNATCYGLAPLAVNIAYREGASPYAVVMIRFIIGSLAIWGLAALLGQVQPLPTRTIVTLVAWGGLLQAAVTSLTFVAFQYADASLVMLLFFTFPVMVTFAAPWFEPEARSLQRWLALALSLVGMSLLLRASLGDLHPLGIVLPLAAAVANAALMITGRRVTQSLPPPLVLAYIFTGSALYASVLAPLMGGWVVPRSGVGWVAVGAVVLLPTVLGAIAFFVALSLLGASQVAIIGTLELVVAVVTAMLWLGDRMVATQVAGAILVVASVVLSQIEIRRPSLSV